MACVTGIVQCCLFIFNIACAIVGLAILTTASVSFVTLKQVDSVSQENHTLVPGLLIGLGATTFIISILGCCGIYQRNECMLITYAAVLLLLFVLQLASGIYAYAALPPDNAEFKEKIISTFEATFKNITTKEENWSIINLCQTLYRCCGVYDYTDYVKLNSTIPIPGTCCELPETETCPTPPKYSNGCGDVLYDDLQYNSKMNVYVNLSISGIEVVAALLAICLVFSYRNDDRRSY